MSNDTKYRPVSDDNLNLFHEVLDATAIPHWIEFELAADDNLKTKEGYIVRKQNELGEYLSDGKQIVIIINEIIFDELEEEYQKKFFEEAISGVVVDNDKIKVEKHDFSTNSGFLEKHGADDVILLKLSIKSLYEKKKQKEDEEKAELKEENKKKN